MDRAHRHYSAGLAYFALGEAGEAETQWRAAITIYRDLDPEGHLLAATLLHVADGLASRNYEGPLTEVEALAMLEEARAIFTRIYGANSQEVGVVDGTLVSIRNQQTTPTKGFVLKPFWVSYLWQLENKDRPESEKRTKDEIRSAVLKSLTIVKSAWKEGRDEDAHRELRSWLDRYLKQNATVARMVPIGVDRAAEEARKHGEGDLAAALSMEALSIARELYGPRHSTTLYHENRHSIILGDFGHRDEAIAGLEESLRVARDALSPGHDIILTALDHLAELRSTGGDPEAARGHMTERMEMTLAHVSVADANFLYAFARRARFECDQNGGEPGGAPAAIPWIEQLVTHLRDADPRPVKRLAEAYLLLGEWQLAAGQPDAAREQIALLRRTLGDKKRLPRKSLRARLAALEKSVGPGREERRE